MMRTEADWKNQRRCRKQFIKNCSTALSISLDLAKRIKGVKTGNAVKSETAAEYNAIMKMCGINKAKLAKSVINK